MHVLSLEGRWQQRGGDWPRGPASRGSASGHPQEGAGVAQAASGEAAGSPAWHRPWRLAGTRAIADDFTEKELLDAVDEEMKAEVDAEFARGARAVSRATAVMALAQGPGGAARGHGDPGPPSAVAPQRRKDSISSSSWGASSTSSASADSAADAGGRSDLSGMEIEAPPRGAFAVSPEEAQRFVDVAGGVDRLHGWLAQLAFSKDADSEEATSATSSEKRRRRIRQRKKAKRDDQKKRTSLNSVDSTAATEERPEELLHRKITEMFRRFEKLFGRAARSRQEAFGMFSADMMKIVDTRPLFVKWVHSVQALRFMRDDLRLPLKELKIVKELISDLLANLGSPVSAAEAFTGIGVEWEELASLVDAASPG